MVVLLAAFALRAAQLSRKPLWWDEGLSAHLAQQSPPDLLDEMQITNHADPPFYPLALSAWRVLAGNSPFALRFLSASLGVAAVALTWTTGCWLAGKRAALLAALFVALSPMQVHYTREAKSYALASACALLSTYAWGRKLGYADQVSSPSKRWWIVYVLSAAAAVGSHYYLGLLVLWQGLWVMGDATLALAREDREPRQTLARLGRWLLAAGAIAVLLTPGTATLFKTTVRGVVGISKADPLALWDYLGRVTLEFCAGPNAERAIAWTASIALAAVGIIGLLTIEKRALTLTWIAAPAVAAYLIQTIYSFFHPRFLLYLGPACCILVGSGVAALWSRRRPLAIALAALMVGLWIPGLAHVHTAPVDEAEDARPAIAHIQAEARPGDALVYVYIWQTGYLFSYYPQNELTLYRAYYTPQSVGEELKAILDAHPRLWLFSYRVAAEDAQNLSGSWLEAKAYKVESNWYGEHHLALYLAPDFQTDGVGPGEDTVSFDAQIQLRYPLVEAQLSPGDALALPLRWRALAEPEEDYQVFLHLGAPDAPPLAQNDGPPKNGLSPTSTWSVGQRVVDRRVLLLPDALPPGRYLVTAGLYRLSDGSRLPVSGARGAKAAKLGYVEVKP